MPQVTIDGVLYNLPAQAQAANNVPVSLVLTGQQAARTQIAPKLMQLKELLDARLPLWNKLTALQKKRTVVNNRDPIISVAWDVFKYLRVFFAGADNDNQQ